MSLTLILLLAALIMTLVSACGKIPLWVPLLLVILALLIPVIPSR